MKDKKYKGKHKMIKNKKKEAGKEDRHLKLAKKKDKRQFELHEFGDKRQKGRNLPLEFFRNQQPAGTDFQSWDIAYL